MIMGLIIKYRFHLLIFLLSFLVLTRFNIDGDLGWHIAYGREFLRSGVIIANDPFSWTIKGHFWANSYFFYQILVAWLFENAGYLATVILFGVISAAPVVLLLPKKLNKLAPFAVLVGVLMASASLGIKPHTFDFLFYAILLFLIERKLYKNFKLVPFWFLFFAIWANFHVGFLIGLFAFSGFVVLDLLKRKKFPGYESALLLAVAWLGTLATPFNFQIWKAIFFDSTSPLGLLYVYEWQPIIYSLKFTLLFVLSGLIFLYIFRKKYQKIDPEWFLLGTVLFMLPFISTFYLIFWAEYFIFITSRYFDIKTDLSKILITLILVVLVLGAIINFGKQLTKSKTLNERFMADGYPVEAMNYIVSHGYTDQLFNHFNWGGFIDWQYPNVTVFIDGRMNGWRQDDGRYIFDEFIQIVRGKCDSFSRYDPKVALVTKGSSEKCFSGWRTVYSDSISKVLVKQNE